jgi:pimeloyl-ACP methyl ester carboxylesterase
LAAEGVRFGHERLEVEDGVRLRLMRWQPAGGEQGPPILFVAGWISLVTGWRPLLEVLVRRHPVFYLETREKRSAEIDERLMRPESFTIERLADDLVETAARLGLHNRRTVLFGSSMGSNAILEALKRDRLTAGAAFVVGPNSEFRFPWWGPLAVRTISPWLIEHLKPFVLWYLRRFRVNVRSDPEQMARYERTIAAADARRLKLSALAVQGYELVPGLETVNTPVAVAYAESDTLHGEAEQRRIVDSLPSGTAVVCPSNTHMHTAAVAADLDRFVAASVIDRETK